MRIAFDYTMEDEEVEFLIDSVAFVAKHGHRFLSLYKFIPETGEWKHREQVAFNRRWLSNLVFEVHRFTLSPYLPLACPPAYLLFRD